MESVFSVQNASLLLATAAIKGTCLLGIAWALVRVSRRASASARHAVWALALLAALVLPVLLVVVPGWELPVLPALETLGAHSITTLDVLPLAVLPPDGVSSGVASWPLMLLAVWALGALVVGAVWARAAVEARRLVRSATPLRDHAWQHAVARASIRLGVYRPVNLRVSGRLRSPMAWGVFRPVVLLPAGAGAWSAERRAVVLTHELAHVRRLDALVQFAAQAACAVHWFNPLVWYAYRRLLVEREHACDDQVLVAGTRPSAYAEHLLDIARTLGREPRAAYALLPMARRSQLEERLRAILSERASRDALSRTLLVVVGVLTFALVWPVVAVRPVASAPPAPWDFEMDQHMRHAIEDSQRELERAQREMERAHREMERAHRDMERAGGSFGRHGMNAPLAPLPPLPPLPPSPPAPPPPAPPAPPAFGASATVAQGWADAPQAESAARGPHEGAERTRVVRVAVAPRGLDARLHAAVAAGLAEADRRREASGEWATMRAESAALAGTSAALAQASAQWAQHDWEASSLALRFDPVARLYSSSDQPCDSGATVDRGEARRYLPARRARPISTP